MLPGYSLYFSKIRDCGWNQFRCLFRGIYSASVVTFEATQKYVDDLSAECRALQPEARSVLEPIDDTVSVEVYPQTLPAFNFAAYVNKSETLKQLVRLGVDLHKLEKRKGVPQFILKLDFDRDMKNHIEFLIDVGVPSEGLGEFITKNPLIFKEDLGNMEVRINYLESKRFLSDQIARIVYKNPYWLMINTRRIDKRLGYFQKTFRLNGGEVRLLTTKQPRIITYNLEHIRKNTFTITEEMGFEKEEIKYLLLSSPKLWMINQDKLQYRFDFAHHKMKLSHAQILEAPEILNSREYRLKHRHGFLNFLGKAQYDPRKDLYISLKTLVEGTDEYFVTNVAKSNMECYNSYLKTL
ncbi:transcription termination factor 3, mitochondrial [Toxorhynchites rutilus septentrionalis]|uniref:transcription termination factor 3, mitochondrial n=1 Tax=Toxorhynchites rutilus septentrionalis TaxID=329112 RepID=UPI002479B908|nr:transcription termination factor 3, mitochondrial [Toxorhynchites rutilus septentrionalis]